MLSARLDRLREETHPDLGSDDFFLINCVDTMLRHHQLSYQQIEDGITDGADDGGVDAMYVFVNGALVDDVAAATMSTSPDPKVLVEVLQSKNESGYGESVLNTLIASVGTMFSYASDEDVNRSSYNAKLRERLRLFRDVILKTSHSFATIQFNIKYATRAEGSPHPKVAAKADQLCELLKKHHPQSRASFEFVGASQLNTAARSRTGKPLGLKMSEGPIGGDLGGWVGLCSISDYLSFITGGEGEILEEIFEENVRGFEGNTMINKEITASLGPQASTMGTAIADFWWLNNGVTILGAKVQPEGSRTLTIRDPQVVNGLQTSRSIFNASRANPESFREVNARRNLLVRVIAAGDEDTAAEIIKATNSQNRISSATLRATDRVQRAVEEYLLSQGYYYERKKNHYKMAGRPRSKIVEVLEVAQAAWSIQQCEPHAARGMPSRLVSRESNYKKIFSDRIPVKSLLVCVQVVRVIDDFLREQGLTRAEASNIRFHLARAAVAFHMKSSRPRWNALQAVNAEEIRTGQLADIYLWLIEQRAKVTERTGSTDLDNLAKGPEWSAEMNRLLSYYSDKVRWPPSLTIS